MAGDTVGASDAEVPAGVRRARRCAVGAGPGDPVMTLNSDAQSDTNITTTCVWEAQPSNGKRGPRSRTSDGSVGEGLCSAI